MIFIRLTYDFYLVFSNFEFIRKRDISTKDVNFEFSKNEIAHYLHIRFRCKLKVEERLGAHPLEGDTSPGVHHLLSLQVHLPGKAEVRYLHRPVFSDENVTGRQVAVYYVLVTQVLLKVLLRYSTG